MKVYRLILGIAAPLAMVSTVALANPALMQKNNPGSPYPGTGAGDDFGPSALEQATSLANEEEGVAPGQVVSREGKDLGRSLLPPKGDPERLSPSPNLEKEGFPLYGPGKPASTAK